MRVVPLGRQTGGRGRAHHAGGAPDVGGRAVVSADQHLHRAVLTRLDVLTEVLVLREERRRIRAGQDSFSPTEALASLHVSSEINMIDGY